MSNQPTNNMERIKIANQEMLNYFNDSFLRSLETVQELKTQAFEIDIKIDELEKTKDIYAFKSSSRKSIFSPVVQDVAESERGQIIDNQIRDLTEVKETLMDRIRSTEHSLTILKHRLQTLTDAEAAIKQVSEVYDKTWSKVSGGGASTLSSTTSDNVEEFSHGYNILMQDAFDKSYLATLLNKDIRGGLDNITHKLDMLAYLLGTDPARAKLTLQEITHSAKMLGMNVDGLCDKLDYHVDSSKQLWTCLDDFIIEQRDRHPECVIDTDIKNDNYEMNLHPVFTINLIKLLSIFFDNVYKHANANHVELNIEVSQGRLVASLTDNGVGIHSDYLTTTPWYSSLHKAHEIIFLLNGKLEIVGDNIKGTAIKFSFPVKG